MMVRVAAAVLCGGWLCAPGVAQQQRLQARVERPTSIAEGHVDASVGEAMRSLAARAGVVFVGQVVSVERKGGVVEVEFRVDHAVQGPVGSTYRLREWAGLWSAGQQRYIPGQRAMVFLRAPNGAGLSSPVDGMEGVVPVVPMGADAAPMLDVRRLAARVQRSVGEPMRGESVTLQGAVAAVRQRGEPELRALPEGWLPKPVAIMQAGVVDVAR